MLRSGVHRLASNGRGARSLGLSAPRLDIQFERQTCSVEAVPSAAESWRWSWTSGIAGLPGPAGKRHATLNLAEAKVSTSASLRDPDDLPGVHRKVLHGVVEAPKRVTVKPWISTRVSSVAKSSRASTASASATARDRSASRSALVGVSSDANSRWRWREAGVPSRPLPEAWYCQVEPDGRF